ncbi:ubiquitin carboxyl-terminal hydrolase 10 isoform X7 [Acinonyx jubatus]|uniref:Ubiquitin carboxyl-terminal hydrolase n=1 Tax=Acinonyx jubatus TaxID=32536 RepID=A0ABM3P5A2_ACIJB|nr:ubiquitin carboxyl-terminal hydrolase 10 isoform X7 [Acinonyx jubatus]
MNECTELLSPRAGEAPPGPSALIWETPAQGDLGVRRPGPASGRGSGLRTSRVTPSTPEARQQVRGPGRPGAWASLPPPPALSPSGTAAGAPSARPRGPHREGARARSPPGPLPPRTPTCRPRMRTRRPARPAAPRPAARGQCAGAAADASVYVRARRWRRRGKQREESDERRGSLKRAAMALRNPQLPPYNGTVLCGTQAPDELPDELLENVTLIHKPVSLQPRGLINKGNWCYINATLQALVACPPMYHLMKFIPLYSKVQRPCTSTPMIDSFVRLMNEFTNMPVPPKPRQALGDKIVRDIRPGAAFEPTYIYRLLTVIKSSLSEKGRQEDAEEYLGFILNGLHEEMLNLKKLLSPNNQKLTVSNGPRSPSVHEDEQDEPGEGSEDEWEQVGPRSKTSVTRQAEFVQTPITGIFGGHIRSVVYQQSSRESATLQPFFTLQLDIQSDKIRTVQDALESLVARESVQGYTTKTKQEVEISRRVTLEKLPPVLVLHLKRFVYEKTGGCQKLVKSVEYPVDLEISKELLSPGVKNKNFKCHRTYRLFAVVYHHGSSATGGHYTTDVFQIGLNGWLRIDDQTVKVVNQYQVVKPTAERTAYLLYYRRVDLL